MTNDYYIYIYYRLDTNEPFYVGKGKGDRWKDLYRKYNKHFTNIINKEKILAVIEKDNLTEEEAFYWEEEVIKQLVFEYGFSIDIMGCNSNDHYCHLVNQTWGGEGISGWKHTEEWKRKMSEKYSNGNSPFSGCKHTEENKRRISESRKGKEHTENTKNKLSKMRKGEGNSFYGKRHTDKTKKKMSENHANFKGKNHPQSKSVICLTTKKIFLSIAEAKEYYKIKGNDIGRCCRGERRSCGKFLNKPLKWKYLIWKHNKKYRLTNKYFK